jgi:hypothetical protein
MADLVQTKTGHGLKHTPLVVSRGEFFIIPFTEVFFIPLHPQPGANILGDHDEERYSSQGVQAGWV